MEPVQKSKFRFPYKKDKEILQRCYELYELKVKSNPDKLYLPPKHIEPMVYRRWKRRHSFDYYTEDPKSRGFPTSETVIGSFGFATRLAHHFEAQFMKFVELGELWLARDALLAVSAYRSFALNFGNGEGKDIGHIDRIIFIDSEIDSIEATISLGLPYHYYDQSKFYRSRPMRYISKKQA